MHAVQRPVISLQWVKHLSYILQECSKVQLQDCWPILMRVLWLYRLDYPGIGPEHSWLMDTGRAEYHAITDSQALDALQLVSKLEGIIPALETSHAFAHLEVGVTVLPARRMLHAGDMVFVGFTAGCCSCASGARSS